MKAGRKKAVDRSPRRLLELMSSPEMVSMATGLHRKTVLELAKAGEFGQCSKPFANKVLIPNAGVNAWLEKNPLVFSLEEKQ